MFVEHDAVNSDIRDGAKLWRYMDFTKLVSLISSKSLYFCRADKFKDVFEGEIFGLEEMRKYYRSVNSNGELVAFEETEGTRSINFDEFLKSTYTFTQFEKQNVFINCWHLNEYESAAMWGLYLKSNEGIAIQTTFGRVKQSLNACNKEIYAGKVEYIDHTKCSNFNGDMISPFFTKRLSFKHEEEVRLVYSALNDKEYSLTENKNAFRGNVKVNLSDLIECVYVSPDAEAWFVEVVKATLKKFDVDVEVIHSKLYELN